MKFTRYISRKALRLVPVVAAGLLCGCSEDIEMPEVEENFDADTQLVIDLAIPYGEQVPASHTMSRGIDDPIGPGVDNPTMAPEINELQINNLQLYIFPYTAAGNVAPVINMPLMTPNASDLTGNKKVSQIYEIKGLDKSKDYTLYILANYGDDARNFTSASQLENKLIDYSKQPHLLQAGNLPMVYKYPTTFKVSNDPGDPLKIAAAMQYACVKLRYSIIFDKDYEPTAGNKPTAEEFGDNFLVPVTLGLENAGTKSRIGWFKEDTDFFENSDNFGNRSLGITNLYSNFTYTPANAAVNNQYVVNGVANRITDVETIGKDSKWVLHSTLYLPERYVSDADNQTKLVLDSELNGAGIGCHHEQAIGYNDDFTKLERGYLYEFVGHIVNKNADGLVWECNVQPWLEKTVKVDFIHTYLTLDKTEVWIDSETNGEIVYDTDGRGAIGFDCEEGDKVNGKNIFELRPVTTYAQRTLVIRPNSKVTLSELKAAGKEEGEVTCYIIAGNIKKAITVKYWLDGFFEVTPSNIKIQKLDGSTDDDHFFEYRTNLGDFTIKSGNINTWSMASTATAGKEHSFANSSITLIFDEGSDSSSGRVKVVNVDYPETTEIHSFTFTPNDTEFADEYAVPVTVDIMPSKENYRVYFRAINDYQVGDGNTFGTVPAEYNGVGLNNSNWTDYWNGSSTSTTPSEIDHCLYAYTQYGEDANTQPVWRYTYWDSGAEFTYTDPRDATKPAVTKANTMKADSGNPGWYYYDIPVSCEGDYDTNLQTELTKPGTALYEKYGWGPIPGATLLIFHSQLARHRVNYDDEPGIPLGDYNDNESWVLFDPSRDPVYNVYDDKPVIENVTYTIYSNVAMTGWQNEFGTNGSGGVHNIHGNFTTSTSASGVSGYPYRYTLILKAPRGEYDKEITLMGGSTTPAVVCIGMYDAPSDWGIPYALFKSENTSGTASDEMFVEMKLIPGQTQEYYAEVPDRFKGKWCCFTNNAKNTGLANWKLYSVPSTNTGMITYYNNTNNWSSKTVNLASALTKMMGGRSWRTGYYKSTASTKWTSSPQ